MSKYPFDFLFNVCLQGVSKVRSDILFAYILVITKSASWKIKYVIPY